MSDYLTAEQYEYARKTGDWESGKVLTHGQALNDNQKIVLDILKDIQNKWPHFHPSTTIGMMVEMQNEFYEELSKDQELEVLAAFARWGLEQEEADE
ncbi:hypothetical protein [Enterococcus sp. HMSC34G12]|uniref:hypothetical protein n=1 Tax=Enterococcus sp. HMSC34G12 TaxID=1608861 RepID=UPI0008AA098C|nr:hypothetical protein [Enterococcus sp. HMSC34G12]OHR71714.1 hypothetical protein HMPREF3242_07020 [Enterococcus sp. HMSC34G12]